MFVLLIVTSSFVFQPKSFNMVTFSTNELCQQALVEAKKQWSTINDQSKCIDLEKEAEIRNKELELKKLKGR